MEWKSREARHFQGGLAPRCGVVVESYAGSNPLAMVVADLVNHEFIFVKRSCFKSVEQPRTKSQHQKDERPYLPKENVQFECNNQNIVTKAVARFNKRFEINMEGSMFLVECRCVFSPPINSTIYCYTDIAGLVPSLRGHFEPNIVPNVTCRCQIAFDYINGLFLDGRYNECKYSINYQLFDVTSTDPDSLDFAYDAPWNRDIRKEMYKDDFEFIDAAEDKKRKYINQLGYYLYGPLILIPSLSRLTIRLAWNKYVGVLRDANTSIEPGSSLNVDVRNHPLVNCYVAVDPAQTNYPKLNVDFIVTKHGPSIITDIKPIKCCPGFFFSKSEQFIVHDVFSVYVDYYDKDEIIKNVIILYQDGDPLSYTPLYIMSDTPFNEDILIGYRFTGICYLIENNQAVFYSPVLHLQEIRLILDENTTDTIFVGNVHELEVIRMQSGKITTLFVKSLRKVYAYKISTDRATKQKSFYMEVKVLREPVIIAFHDFCGAIAMGEATCSKVPGLQHHFPAIVGFRKLPCEFQLRPYIKRMARHGDERIFEFEEMISNS